MNTEDLQRVSVVVIENGPGEIVEGLTRGTTEQRGRSGKGKKTGIKVESLF